MKRTISGTGLLITGAILFLSVCTAAGSAAAVLNGWIDSLGPFWQAVSNAKLMPFVFISVVFMLTGIGVMLWDLFGKAKE